MGVLGGEAFARSGASPRHNAVVMNTPATLLGRLKGKPCFPLGSDQKVATTATGAFHYPDVTIVCGKPRYSPKDENAITNPTILIEVASPSTSDYDRGAKFDHYATIPDLAELVVIFTDTRRVEHRKRAGDGQWLITHLVGGEVRLERLGITLPLDAVYADLERVEPER